MSDFGGAIKKRDSFDIAVLGVPFDGKSSFMKGTSAGPEAIRKASTGEAINAWTELGVDLEEELIITDLGDVDVTGDFFSVSSRLESLLSKISLNFGSQTSPTP